MRTKEGNKHRDIMEAAIIEFADSGYHTAKIAKIAERAKVAAGSVYLYFQNKDDILLQIFVNIWEELLTKIQAEFDKTELPFHERIWSILNTVVDVFSSNNSLAVLFIQEQKEVLNYPQTSEYHNRFLNIMDLIIKEGLENKYFRTDLNSDLLKEYVIGSIKMILYYWGTNSDKFTIEELKANLSAMLLEGIKIK